MSIYVSSEYGGAEWGISEWNRAGYLSDQITLSWSPSPSPDVDYYTVRYSPSIAAAWEQGVEVYRTPSYLLTQTEEFSCKLDNASEGVYMVAATDTSGNEGAEARVTYGDVDLDWRFIKRIAGQPDFYGEIYEMRRTSDGKLLLINRGGGVDTYPEGFIYGWYQHAENYNGGPSPKTVRFVVDRLALEKGDVRGTYQWRNNQSGVTEWQDFRDTTAVVEGEVEFRVEIRNYTLDQYAIISECEVLVYEAV